MEVIENRLKNRQDTFMKEEAYLKQFEFSKNYWWFTARQEIIRSVLKKFIKPGSRILDYGAGDGVNGTYLLEHGFDVTAADISTEALAICEKFGLKTINLNNSELQSSSAECVLLGDVLEHIENDAQLLIDLKKTLAPNGIICATVPAYELLWSGEDFVSNHLRRYTRAHLLSVFRSAGLKVEFSTYFNFFLFPLIVFIILNKRVFRPKEMYQSNLEKIPVLLNKIFHSIFVSESKLLKFIRFPFGGSILIVARVRQ